MPRPLLQATAQLLALILGLMLSSLSQAQSAYPSRQVKIMVQYPPGGVPDLVARLLGEKLGERLGQPFIVDNRAGGSGNIATDLVAKAPADGYTLLLSGGGPIVINVSLFSRLPFDPVKDFAPITMTSSIALALLARPGLPVATVSDLISLARAQPGKLSYGSTGNGTEHHLTMELLRARTGIQMVHIPYKGVAPAMTDLMAGNIDVMFGSVPAAMPYVKGGKMRALAVSSGSRFQGAPEIPTLGEAGLQDFVIESWHGLLAPAGTPKEIIDRLSGESRAILRQPATSEWLTERGIRVIASSPEEFAAQIRSDIVKWAAAVKASGAKID